MDGVAAPTPSVIGHDFFDRVRARLHLEVPAALHDHTAAAVRGDLDQDPELWTRAGVSATRPAAVLVPVVDRPDPTVLLTQRTAELPSHAGVPGEVSGRQRRQGRKPADSAAAAQR